jgi:hypothetical protein
VIPTTSPPLVCKSSLTDLWHLHVSCHTQSLDLSHLRGQGLQPGEVPQPKEAEGAAAAAEGESSYDVWMHDMRDVWMHGWMHDVWMDA